MSTSVSAAGLHLAACLLALSAASSTWPSEAAAHEVGTTAVTATVDGRHYTVQLTLDPASLVAKLDAAAGRPRPGPLSVDDYERLLERRADEILRHVTVTFDDRQVTPSLESVSEAPATPTGPAEDSLAAPRICLRLTGNVPHGARTFRWSYDLTFASYRFIVKRAAGPVGRVEWLEGGRPSSPFELGIPSPLGAASLQTARAALFGALLILALALGLRLLPHIQNRLWSVERRCQSRVPAAPGPFSSRSRVS
ncbi:MAG TPA: hypothetical protein VFV95_18465 [Vicinamibacterales bacterium]|nr:hypothetical protein [Vicinamibacterales bacterium]